MRTPASPAAYITLPAPERPCAAPATFAPCAPSTIPPLPAFAALPTGLRNLCRCVRDFMEGYCAPALNVGGYVLAVSGGADSLALLTILALWRQREDMPLSVVQCDHGLRPQSRAEALYVREVCTAWGIPCTLAELQVAAFAAASGTGVEEAARGLRYAALELARHALAADAWVCTAHHVEDVQEDMLLRLVRGTGWPALGGMCACDPARHVCRPLLGTEPEALKGLLRHVGLAWVEDASNAAPGCRRNRIRHTVLPLLRQENPHFSRASLDVWRMAQEDAAHWEDSLQALLRAHGLPAEPGAPLTRLPCSLLRACDRATRMRLYVRAMRSLARGQARRRTLERLDAAIMARHGGTCFQLPGKVSARIDGDALVFVTD